MVCDIADGPSASTHKWRKAIKSHECCACYETIRPGDRYHYISGIWDGEPQSFKHCARCWAVFKEILWMSSEPYVDLLLDCGELWEDNFGDLPDDIAELAFLTPDEAQFKLVEGYGD